MKIEHKNSKEVIDLPEPRFYKMGGIYGYLVANDNKVFFISNYDSELECEEVTEVFNIL